MWIVLILLLLLFLILWEGTRELPSCQGWDNLFYCLDLNHNHVHWIRCAILAIILSLLIVFLLNAVCLYNFILLFLVLFIVSYFTSNWGSAHINRPVDFSIEASLKKLRERFRD